MGTGAAVVSTPEDSALLARVLAAVRTGAPVAVVDPRWPSELAAALASELDDAVAAGRVRPGDLVLATSGSSGVPRAVVRSVASWDASLGPLSQVTGISGRDVVWTPGPLTSSLSLYGAWHATALGARLRLRGDADLTDVTAVHCVPSVLAALAAAPERLPSLRVAVVAGDRLTPSVRAAAALHGWDVVEYYGAAELSFVAHRRDDGPFTAFAGVDVEVRPDAQHAAIGSAHGAGVAGVVWVRSPFLSRGYLVPHPGGPWRHAVGWATVGDTGVRDAGGLVLHGRGGDAVVTGGWSVVAADVERHLAMVPGVDGVAVVGVPDDRLGQVVAAVVAGRADPEALRQAASRLPAASRPRRWLLLPEMPVTDVGKVSRSEVAERLADGRLPAPGPLASPPVRG